MKKAKIGPKSVLLKSTIENNKVGEISLNLDSFIPVQQTMIRTILNAIHMALRSGVSVTTIVTEMLHEEGHPVISELREFLQDLEELGFTSASNTSDSGTSSTVDSSMASPVSHTTKPTEIDKGPLKESQKETISIMLDTDVKKESCTGCGATQLRQNGTCMVCEVCGETTGCS